MVFAVKAPARQGYRKLARPSSEVELQKKGTADTRLKTTSTRAIERRTVAIQPLHRNERLTASKMYLRHILQTDNTVAAAMSKFPLVP